MLPVADGVLPSRRHDDQPLAQWAARRPGRLRKPGEKKPSPSPTRSLAPTEAVRLAGPLTTVEDYAAACRPSARSPKPLPPTTLKRAAPSPDATFWPQALGAIARPGSKSTAPKNSAPTDVPLPDSKRRYDPPFTVCFPEEVVG